ncbi:hypothetical protein H340_18401 [Streptomyces mobaraensis NBRC 13819 = DSM 40847]|uniref:SUKH-3 domain containing protein n=1 Tax=Streptomyces mobaraensis (strain ATCC 29032 / DSM 40847 / JCM 4168 / NBRC 13819 / NCIMB 11159 / IPCR 16-22) TaxID=1223523 RepID=M3BHI8_STRM1|nr:SUKH-3 domain-containing protein [Streptomyces mobaraensis]EME99034.1 hypothetical protein H340_18401 [Streptomyces mobaraensis NBRC 13819 = DSM 40847]
MGAEIPKSVVEEWLRSHGWSPERDIGDQADRLIAERVEDSTRQGHPLRPSEASVRFLHSFGGLDLAYPETPEIRWIVDPTVGYEGDAAEFAEFSEDLGRPLFPVGGETSEAGFLLMDDLGRCFYQHWSGRYYVGEDAWGAFAKRLRGTLMQDAEDFYV